MRGELQPWRPAGETPWQPPRSAGAADRFFQASLLHTQLHRYLDALRRRWWVMALALGLIGGPALLYAWHKPPSYQAQASMCRAELNLPGVDVSETSSFLGTQAQLLKSPQILAQAFGRVRTQFAGWSAGLAPGAVAESPFELSVRTSQRSSFLELKATGPEPEPTRAFLEAVMEEYRVFMQNWREHTTTGAVTTIDIQLQEVKRQIATQQERVELFGRSNNVPYQTEKVRSGGSRLAELTRSLSELKADRQLLDVLTPTEWMKSQNLPPNAALEVVRANATQQLQERQAKSAELSKVLRPAHSKMVKLRQEVASLEQFLKQLDQKDAEEALKQMENRKKTLGVKLQSVQSLYNTLEAESAEASRIVAEEERMRQELQRLETRREHLETLAEVAKMNEKLDRQTLVPVGPVSPARPTVARQGIAAAGLFLGLLVGIGAFLFLGFLDDRFTSATELSLHLPTEVVGQIPRSSLALPHGASHLLPLTSAQPAFAESFRNLRSSLLFMSGQEVAPKVVLITSAIPKEGKTTVASNLAGILAMSGARVLLVDADFRRGYIHRMFQLPRKPGLLEVLSEQLPVAQAIAASGQPNLFVLPTGESGDYTSDVLLRYRVDRLLQTLAKDFDHVIVDSAPVLATDDAACIGPYTDGAYLVVRAAFTASRMTLEAWGRLTRRNVKVLGVIYNCAPTSGDYYSHYSREYGSARSPRFPETGESAGNGNGNPVAGD
jgi:polysaccharide biosynthesis transport protein